MQVPIMAGVTVKDRAFAASYPTNLEPRAIDSGVSNGQLVTTRGAETVGTGPGLGRGGVAWNGQLYRVMGSKLCTVAQDGAVTILGDVGDDNAPCGFAYGFDRLAIRSAKRLYYYNGSALSEVTDADLGVVLDVAWLDGYFITCDGSSLVVTELLDPASVDPIKYGSAESDPDPIVGVLPFREELYAFGRYTIEVFQNVGGLAFPFQVQQGATIPFGAVSADAKCAIGGNSFAFVGGAKDEPIGVFVYEGGNARRISDRDIDTLLAAEASPAMIRVESRSFGAERLLIVHLTDRSIGIALAASAQADDGAWFHLRSGADKPYRIRGAVWCYGKHWVEDLETFAIGTLSDADDRHFGEDADWTFDSAIVFNGGAGYIVGEVELFGQVPTTETAIFLSMTRDGVQWSREIAVKLTGRLDQRIVWRPGVRMSRFGGFRWRGTGRVAWARCEMGGEALSA